MLLVVATLSLPAPARLLQGGANRVGLRVGVEDHLAIHVASGAPDRLDERAGRTQEALLVGVEDRDEGDLWDVETLAQEVDADEDVEDALPQLPDDLHALDRLDVAVQVADLDTQLGVVLGEFLGHALRQRRDQDSLALRDHLADDS